MYIVYKTSHGYNISQGEKYPLKIKSARLPPPTWKCMSTMNPKCLRIHVSISIDRWIDACISIYSTKMVRSGLQGVHIS